MPHARVLALAAGLTVSACAKAPPLTAPPDPAPMFASSIHNVIPKPVMTEPGTSAGFTITGDTRVVVAPGNEQAMWIGR
jgi:hypothetical protein